MYVFIFAGYEKLQLKAEPSELHVFMKDCELCNDEDLNPDTVDKKMLVLGTSYEEYMADVQNNDSIGTSERIDNGVTNEAKIQQEVNNNNGDKVKTIA